MRAASSTAVLLLALVAITLNRVGAYPIIAEIDEDDETVSHQERARMTKSKHHTSVSVGTGNVLGPSGIGYLGGTTLYLQS